MQDIEVNSKQLVNSDADETYSVLSQQAQDLRKELLHTIALKISPALSKYAHSQRCETFDEKRALASWVNSEAQKLGLRLQCPVTQRPATLSAEMSYGGGRFGMSVSTEHHQQKKSYSSKSLPPLQLMIDPAEFSPPVRVKTHDRIYRNR